MGKKRAKRANGEGSIKRQPNGRYKVTVTVSSGGEQIRRSKTLDSHADAVAWLARIKAESFGPQAVSPVAADGSACLLVDWFSTWIADKRRECDSPKTADLYEECADLHIIPAMGRLKLADITPTAVRNFLHALATRGMAGTRRMQQCFETLSRALNAAVSMELIPRNPCRGIPKPKYERKTIDPFTADEARAIMEGAALSDYSRMHPLFVLGFTTGMRIGEMFGLEWECVNFDDGTLRVERQAVTSKGKLIVKPPKSKASRRTIRLPQMAVDALNQRRADAMAEGLAACPIVFPGKRGAHWRNPAFGSRVWRPLLSRIGLRPRGVHHMRHTYATLTLGAGEPIHVVSAILGHADISVTLKTYAHAIPDQQHRAAETAQRVFGAR